MKRKGFTLIELLAVIVILAIIAVIATPIIIGIIEDSRKAAFERSVEGIMHALDLDYSMQDVLENSTYEIENGQIKDKTLKTPIKNLEGFNGKIVYDENGNSQFAINNGSWCMTKDSGGVITTSKYNSSTCKLAVPLSDECFVTEDLEDGGVAIVDYVCTEKDVIIPDIINGKVVKEITGREVYIDDGDYYEYNGAFEAAIISDEICEEVCYGYECWDDCETIYTYENQINSIKLPNSIINIGNYAFANNNISGELDLSNTNISKIGDYAFNGDYDRNTNQITALKLPNTVTSIGYNAFEYNAISGELDLSNTNIINIGYAAFADNSICNYNEEDGNIICDGGITSIKLPSSVTTIGDSAFANNNISGELDLSHLTNLTSVSGFGNNEITSIKLPSGVINIEIYAFSGNNIKGELDLSMYSNLTDVSGFDDNEITSIRLPISITRIRHSAFANNSISGELDFSDTNIIMIEDSAFEGSYDGSTNQITILKLPNTVAMILDVAFRYNALTSVTFVGRSNLDGVSIGEEVWGWAEGYSDANIEFSN